MACSSLANRLQSMRRSLRDQQVTCRRTALRNWLPNHFEPLTHIVQIRDQLQSSNLHYNLPEIHAGIEYLQLHSIDLSFCAESAKQCIGEVLLEVVYINHSKVAYMIDCEPGSGLASKFEQILSEVYSWTNCLLQKLRLFSQKLLSSMSQHILEIVTPALSQINSDLFSLETCRLIYCCLNEAPWSFPLDRASLDQVCEFPLRICLSKRREIAQYCFEQLGSQEAKQDLKLYHQALQLILSLLQCASEREKSCRAILECSQLISGMEELLLLYKHLYCPIFEKIVDKIEKILLFFDFVSEAMLGTIKFLVKQWLLKGEFDSKVTKGMRLLHEQMMLSEQEEDELCLYSPHLRPFLQELQCADFL